MFMNNYFFSSGHAILHRYSRTFIMSPCVITNRVRIMMINATFSNNSAISWRSVLLVDETGVPGENHRPVASHRQTLSHNIV